MASLNWLYHWFYLLHTEIDGLRINIHWFSLAILVCAAVIINGAVQVSIGELKHKDDLGAKVKTIGIASAIMLITLAISWGLNQWLYHGILAPVVRGIEAVINYALNIIPLSVSLIWIVIPATLLYIWFLIRGLIYYRQKKADYEQWQQKERKQAAKPAPLAKYLATVTINSAPDFRKWLKTTAPDQIQAVQVGNDYYFPAKNSQQLTQVNIALKQKAVAEQFPAILTGTPQAGFKVVSANQAATAIRHYIKKGGQ